MLGSWVVHIALSNSETIAFGAGSPRREPMGARKRSTARFIIALCFIRVLLPNTAAVARDCCLFCFTKDISGICRWLFVRSRQQQKLSIPVHERAAASLNHVTM